MTTIINAALSGGLINSADTSGILQLQTASTAALTINASQQVQVNTGGSASAPVISKSDDTNTGIFFPAADTIAFTEGGVESMRIDSSGNVGIGSTSINNNKFLVKGTHVAGRSLAALQTDQAATGSTVYLGFYNSSDTRIGTIGCDTASSMSIYALENVPLVFATNNTERMRINAGAPILCLAGGNTSATGTGIAFPATQSASSDANCLDDYEEGTFTPSYTSAGISAVTYGTGRNGYYVKIGRMVTVIINIMTDSVTVTNGSSFVFISGLPFTATSDTENNSAADIASSSRFSANPPGSGVIGRTTSSITLYRANATYTTAGDPSQSTASDFATGVGNNNTLRLTATYFV